MASGELETLLIAHVSLMQRLAMSVLGAGQLPRHIAFIMDGNRRFARCSIFVLKKCKPPKRRGRGKETIEGHKGGFFKLAEALQWCRQLGVKEVKESLVF